VEVKFGGGNVCDYLPLFFGDKFLSTSEFSVGLKQKKGHSRNKGHLGTKSVPGLRYCDSIANDDPADGPGPV
jgi:hypothetical protein